MAISFTPSAGDVLMCDFGPDPRDPAVYPLAAGPISVPPEMVKRRQVLVLRADQRLATVVPFSTVQPAPMRPYHLHFAAGSYPFFAAGAENWLKADMICTVSVARLDRIWYAGRYQRSQLTAQHLRAARQAALHGLSLGLLAGHL